MPIAFDLVTTPSILFYYEPTSGTCSLPRYYFISLNIISLNIYAQAWTRVTP